MEKLLIKVRQNIGLTNIYGKIKNVIYLKKLYGENSASRFQVQMFSIRQFEKISDQLSMVSYGYYLSYLSVIPTLSFMGYAAYLGYLAYPSYILYLRYIFLSLSVVTVANVYLPYRGITQDKIFYGDTYGDIICLYIRLIRSRYVKF